MILKNEKVDCADKDAPYNLIRSISEHTKFDHPVDKLELIETHISYVLLTGTYVYKFKKHINLGFLNFSTIEHRRRYCLEEVRLNRRTAPALYIGVVAITGSLEQPLIGGDKNILEYAVKMLQFPKYAELSHVINDGRLNSDHIDNLALHIAEFHQSSDIIPLYHSSGSAQLVRSQSEDNFITILNFLPKASQESEKLAKIHQWVKDRYRDLNWSFIERKYQGKIRDCHGDLHSGNVVLLEDKLYAFDCIEFSDELRQIDVISDIAFLLMDLEVRDKLRPAFRLLNSYLSHTGDYHGLALLNFYKLYRALVRLKVVTIRLQQTGLADKEIQKQWLDLRSHLDLANRYTQKQQTALIITHGMSASGKSSFSQFLLEEIGAIRIRSDIERKRLHYLHSHARSHSAPGEGIYTKSDSEQIYNHLGKIAKNILNAGFKVIVDATFLCQAHREIFKKIASDLNVAFVIVDLQASKPCLERRIADRLESSKSVSEADKNVLEYQFASAQPLAALEIERCVVVNTEADYDKAEILRQIQKKTRRDSSL